MGCASSNTQAVENVYADPSTDGKSELKNLHADQATTLLEAPRQNPKASTGFLLPDESVGCSIWLEGSPVSLDAMKVRYGCSPQDGADLDGTCHQDREEGMTGKFSDAGTRSERVGDIVAVPMPQIHRSELIIKGVLGCGGFGKVELVEHNESKETFALKTMSKAFIQIKEFQNYVLNEKTIQMMCDSPFITKLYETYCDFDNLYLLLELALGGDVEQTYEARKLHGSKHHTQFYFAGCAFALEYLHAHDVIFRDVKPENMIITASGHIKLSDFGVAKVAKGKTFTVCGTLQFLAPEMLAKIGYTNAVDWWALGIATFWMMTGEHPFNTKNQIQVSGRFEKVLKEKFLRIGSTLEGDCQAFLKDLCREDPAARLPVAEGGVENLYSHPWFTDFDWEGMLAMTLEPPYQPNVRSNPCLEAGSFDLPPQLPFYGYDDAASTAWFAHFPTCD